MPKRSGLLDAVYSTDPVGNVLAIDRGPGARAEYAYLDVAYFLTAGRGPWGAEAYTYDTIGNRLSAALPDDVEKCLGC